jgi:hypothetical protein
VIKLDDPAVYLPETNNFIVDANVTIDMRGATLHKRDDGPIIEIKNNRAVTILGGTIEIATGGNGDGVLCNDQVTLTIDDTTIKTTDKSAINMLTGCNLIATHVNITSTSLRMNTFVPGIVDNGDSIALSRSSFISNRGGGLAVNTGTFAVVGNAFLNNGLDNGINNMSPTGGIVISTTQNPTNRLDFNTVASNTIQDGGKGGGIDCNVGANFVGKYNIFRYNKPSIGALISQISGSCKYAYSDIGPLAVLPSNDSGNNLSSDPLLVNEQSDPHLKMGSPAIGYADTGADLTGVATNDIDGDVRTKRTNKGADIGADQYHGP